MFFNNSLSVIPRAKPECISCLAATRKESGTLLGPLTVPERVFANRRTW